jgi:alpha-glucosidase
MKFKNILLNKRIWSCLIAILIIKSSVMADSRDGLLGKDIAIFYPANFDSASNLPSMALTQEFPTTGSLPGDWKLVPKFYTKSGKSYASFAVSWSISLYGTGEVTGPLLRNGQTITLWNTDNYNYTTDNGSRLYQSHPWVLGVNTDGSAFGIMADNTWRQQVALTDSIHFISDGPAFRIIVIQGKSPKDVISSLSTLIGKMSLPPLWALGYQQCRFSYYPDTQVEQIASSFVSKKIPCDVVWVDIDYMNGYRIFTFNPTGFPDPKGVNDYIHALGMKTVWMIDPGVKSETGYGIYDAGTSGNHWVQNSSGGIYNGSVWPGKCAFLDFTRPETRTWWSGLYTDFLAKGIDGVWNDMNEPSVFDGPGGTMPIDNIHRGGGGLPKGSHLRYHNVYGSLMVKATREGMLNVHPNNRPFVLSRSGFLGSHRYAATWTGDNVSTSAYMKMSVPMSLNLGLSGQAFSGADIGGYSGNVTSDLYGQWIALGVFYPFARGHSEKGANQKEPWAFGTTIEDVARTAISRRYRLLPYFYTLFQEAASTGLPVMRPIFFSNPADMSLRNEGQAFLIGDNLLVIPKWAVSPTLPKGLWRTFSLVGEDSKKDTYQPEIKLKGGAVLPLNKVIQSTAQYLSDSVSLFVSLDSLGHAYGTMYQDSGDGYQYLNVEYAISEFTAEKNGNDVTVTIGKKEGNLSIAGTIYQVTIITNNATFSSNWSKDTSVTVTIEPETSVAKEQLKTEKFSLYPNPIVDDNLRLTLYQPGNGNICIYTTTGIKVYETPINSTNLEYNLDMKNREKGCYFIEVNIGNTITAKKIIKL